MLTRQSEAGRRIRTFVRIKSLARTGARSRRAKKISPYIDLGNMGSRPCAGKGEWEGRNGDLREPRSVQRRTRADAPGAV